MKKPGSNFYMLWQGNLISQLGTHAFNIARVYWLVETANEGYYVGLLLMLCSLTIAFFSPIGGYCADKYNKKSIIIVSDLFSGILMLLLALIMFLDIAIDIKTNALFIFSIWPKTFISVTLLHTE
jgi:DHA3 family macrolide efflux protein-like MFS transporter